MFLRKFSYNSLIFLHILFVMEAKAVSTQVKTVKARAGKKTRSLGRISGKSARALDKKNGAVSESPPEQTKKSFLRTWVFPSISVGFLGGVIKNAVSTDRLEGGKGASVRENTSHQNEGHLNGNILGLGPQETCEKKLFDYQEFFQIPVSLQGSQDDAIEVEGPVEEAESMKGGSYEHGSGGVVPDTSFSSYFHGAQGSYIDEYYKSFLALLGVVFLGAGVAGLRYMWKRNNNRNLQPVVQQAEANAGNQIVVNQDEGNQNLGDQGQNQPGGIPPQAYEANKNNVGNQAQAQAQGPNQPEQQPSAPLVGLQGGVVEDPSARQNEAGGAQAQGPNQSEQQPSAPLVGLQGGVVEDPSVRQNEAGGAQAQSSFLRGLRREKLHARRQGEIEGEKKQESKEGMVPLGQGQVNGVRDDERNVRGSEKRAHEELIDPGKSELPGSEEAVKTQNRLREARQTNRHVQQMQAKDKDFLDQQLRRLASDVDEEDPNAPMAVPQNLVIDEEMRDLVQLDDIIFALLQDNDNDNDNDNDLRNVVNDQIGQKFGGIRGLKQCIARYSGDHLVSIRQYIEAVEVEEKQERAQADRHPQGLLQANPIPVLGNQAQNDVNIKKGENRDSKMSRASVVDLNRFTVRDRLVAINALLQHKHDDTAAIMINELGGPDVLKKYFLTHQEEKGFKELKSWLEGNKGVGGLPREEGWGDDEERKEGEMRPEPMSAEGRKAEGRKAEGGKAEEKKDEKKEIAKYVEFVNKVKVFQALSGASLKELRGLIPQDVDAISRWAAQLGTKGGPFAMIFLEALCLVFVNKDKAEKRFLSSRDNKKIRVDSEHYKKLMNNTPDDDGRNLRRLGVGDTEMNLYEKMARESFGGTIRFLETELGTVTPLQLGAFIKGFNSNSSFFLWGAPQKYPYATQLFEKNKDIFLGVIKFLGEENDKIIKIYKKNIIQGIEKMEDTGESIKKIREFRRKELIEPGEAELNEKMCNEAMENIGMDLDDDYQQLYKHCGYSKDKLKKVLEGDKY